MTKNNLPLVVKSVVVILIGIGVATLMLYPLRNSTTEAVSERFLRNNETILNEVGEIKEFVKPISRSEEIARKLKNDEKLSETNNKPLANKIVGTRKTIEYQISIEEHEYFNRGIYYFVVKEARYRVEGEDWREIPLGYFENYFLLFK